MDGNYYVGYTERAVETRYLEHLNDIGACWTRLHKPIRIIETRAGTKKDEDNLTIKYMMEYYWTRVRGGKWCEVEMNTPPKQLRDLYLRLHRFREASISQPFIPSVSEIPARYKHT